MSQEQQSQNSGGNIVNVKRVRKDIDAKGREKVVLTFGTDRDGNNGLDGLLNTLEALRGRQANFDIRLEEKTSQSGAKFLSAFVIVKEMIPRAEGGGTGKATYVPKNTQRAEEVAAKADKIRKTLG